MNTGPDLPALGHYFEDFKNKAYPDPATGGDPWTCGIGCTGVDSDGIPITKDTYWDDAKVLKEYAHRIDTEFSPGVSAALKVQPTQKEFDAMVDLAFNIGMGAFRSSTLLKKYNAGDKPGAAEQFLVWNKGGGKVMKGLQRRRWADRFVFLGGSAANGISEALHKYP